MKTPRRFHDGAFLKPKTCDGLFGVVGSVGDGVTGGADVLTGARHGIAGGDGNGGGGDEKDDELAH